MYNPSEKKILKTITSEYEELPRTRYLIQENGHLWQIGPIDEPPIISMFDSRTGEQLLNIDQFIAKHSELKSGIAQIFYQNNPHSMRITTKDGRNYIYLFGLLLDEGESQGELFVLKIRGFGAIGFDIKTGCKLWQI